MYTFKDIIYDLFHEGHLDTLDVPPLDVIKKCLMLSFNDLFNEPFPGDTSWKNVRRYSNEYLYKTRTTNHGEHYSMYDVYSDPDALHAIASRILEHCRGDLDKLCVGCGSPASAGYYMLRFRTCRWVSLIGRFPHQFWTKILRYYRPKSVWDPCVGHSDRLYATWEWDPQCKYYGTDISPLSIEAATKTASHLGFKSTLSVQDSTAPDFVLPEPVDLAATCPPYADTEVYSGGKPFGSNDAWLKFLDGLARNMYKNTKPDGHAVIFIGNSIGNPYINDTVTAFKANGWTLSGADRAQKVIGAGNRKRSTTNDDNPINNTLALHFSK